MTEKLTDNTQNQTQYKMYNIYNIELNRKYPRETGWLTNQPAGCL